MKSKRLRGNKTRAEDRGVERMSQWKRVLVLDSGRTVVEGSAQNLVDGLRKGADMRISTEFIHNEHIDVTSDCTDLIRETCEFGVTYLVENRWAAGIMSLRQPVGLPDSFGPRSSMSFFLYNQDGGQAIARPYLDGATEGAFAGAAPLGSGDDMPKYHSHETWDDRSNAPSGNFVYDFEVFRYFVRDCWEEVLCHDADGNTVSGSVDALMDAFTDGRAVKVGIGGLCSDLAGDEPGMKHEVFVEAGSCYCYVDRKLFIAGSHPVIRIKPGIPLQYRSGGWDFGWLLLRTDGTVVYRRCDPYTLAFTDERYRHTIRWFVR